MLETYSSLPHVIYFGMKFLTMFRYVEFSAHVWGYATWRYKSVPALFCLYMQRLSRNWGSLIFAARTMTAGVFSIIHLKLQNLYFSPHLVL